MEQVFAFGDLGNHLGETLLIEPKEMDGSLQILSIVGVLRECLFHKDGRLELRLDVFGNTVTIDSGVIHRIEIVPAVSDPFAEVHEKLIAELDAEQNCRCTLLEPEPKTFDGGPDFRAARWEW